MAIIKTSALVTLISGKVGGQTFVNGAQGNYLKNNGNYQKRATQNQQIQRSNSSFVLRSWKNLTPTQQASYTSQVGNFTFVNRVGDTKSYNAFQIFMLLNQNAIRYEAPLITTCPSPYTFPVATATCVSTFPNTLFGSQTGMNGSDKIIVYASPPQNSTFGNPYVALKQIGIAGASTFAITTDLTTRYSDTFSPLVTGQHIFLSFKQLSTTSYQTTDFFSSQFVTIS